MQEKKPTIQGKLSLVTILIVMQMILSSISMLVNQLTAIMKIYMMLFYWELKELGMGSRSLVHLT
jgi:hypothetical protein